jgi:DNA gyrase/topoisomerase IV subunit A
MEDSFGINNVALVDGQPRTLGLKALLEVYNAHRLDVSAGARCTAAARPRSGCTSS